MSMKIGEKAFKERIGDGLEDAVMRGAVSSAQERLYKKKADCKRGAWQLGEKWRELGEEIRQHTLTHLDDYLYQLSESVSARGGHVFLRKQRKRHQHIFKTWHRRKQAKRSSNQNQWSQKKSR
ncbi:hypothetical protein BsIDN1_33010 [Bacillus safensis]|uniref:Uncharacterized protein n=1 Tax=Bacillus safensis TaxID=561879 RepID=A0A5S9M972_BACIA|nr:hypothetical protein BsIDN1_33010 [Bacillus safensis]